MIAALRKSGAETPVAQVMRTEHPDRAAVDVFDRAFAKMQKCGCPALPVLDSLGGSLVSSRLRMSVK